MQMHSRCTLQNHFQTKKYFFLSFNGGQLPRDISVVDVFIWMNSGVNTFIRVGCSSSYSYDRQVFKQNAYYFRMCFNLCCVWAVWVSGQHLFIPNDKSHNLCSIPRNISLDVCHGLLFVYVHNVNAYTKLNIYTYVFTYIYIYII